MSLSVKFVGATEFNNWLTNNKDIFVKVSKTTMETVVKEGVQEMQKNAPVDTGFLLANITGRVTGTGNAIIESRAYYSIYVNFGTRFMSAQPFFSDGVEYIKERIQKIMMEQLKSHLRRR